MTAINSAKYTARGFQEMMPTRKSPVNVLKAPVNVILITHEQVGTALLKTVTHTFGKLPLPTISVPITHECDPACIVDKLKQLIGSLDNHNGVLILTDLYGATPTNIAQKLQNNVPVRIISGINLPMLIRVMNYPNLSLDDLAEKAKSGGKDGVLDCATTKGEHA